MVSGVLSKRGHFSRCTATILWLAGGVLLAVPVMAEPPAKNAPAPGLLDQKAGIVDRFLQRSESLQQEAGRSEAVQKEVARIRSLRQQAMDAQTAGDNRKAQGLLDKAVAATLALSRQLADPAKQAWLHKAHYEDLLEGVASFQQSYTRHWQASGGKVAQTVDLAKIAALTAEAKAMAEQKRYEEANTRLVKARDDLVAGLKGLLDSKTLVYDLKFATPADEYKYEVDRAGSLEALIRMALTGGKVAAEGQRRVMELMGQSQQFSQEGRALATAGEFKTAIARMEKSNELLIQALRAAGVPVF